MKLGSYILIFLTFHSTLAWPEKNRAVGRLLRPFQHNAGTLKPVRDRVKRVIAKKKSEPVSFSIPDPNFTVNFDNAVNSSSKSKDPEFEIKPSNNSGFLDGINPAGLRAGDLNPTFGSGTPTGQSSGSPSGNNSKGNDDEGNRGPKNPIGSGQNGDISSEGQSFGLWWPVCVFVDGPDANAQIAKLVKMSADCQVNLVPFVRKVSLPNPDDPDSVNKLQTDSCNLVEGGIAGKGSTLVVTDRSKTLADKMCGTYDPKKPNDTNTAGCNELASTASAESRKLWEGNSGGEKGSVASGQVAAGAVDFEGYADGSVYSHETIGHGQMGLPNGSGSGNGIKDPNNTEDKGGEHVHGGGTYSPRGCTYMRNAAISDPTRSHKYYANKTTYYNHNMTLFQIGEKIWKNFKDGPQNDGLLTRRNPPGGSTGGLEANESLKSTAGGGSSQPHPNLKIASGRGGRGSSVRSGTNFNSSSRSLKGQRGGRTSEEDGSIGELPARQDTVSNDGGVLTMTLDKGSAFGKASSLASGAGTSQSSANTGQDNAGNEKNSVASDGGQEAGASDSERSGLERISANQENGSDNDFFEEPKAEKTEVTKRIRKSFRTADVFATTESQSSLRSPASNPSKDLEPPKTSIGNNFVSTPAKKSSGSKSPANRGQLQFENTN